MFYQFCLHFGYKNEPKSDLKSVENMMSGSCCSQEVPRPPPQGCPRDPQGCPRGPQGLHFRAFWCPKAPQGCPGDRQGLHFGPFGLPKVPKGPPRAPFWNILKVLCPPWAPLGTTIGPFLILLGTILVHVRASQPTEAKKIIKIVKSKQRATKKQQNRQKVSR